MCLSFDTSPSFLKLCVVWYKGITNTSSELYLLTYTFGICIDVRQISRIHKVSICFLHFLLCIKKIRYDYESIILWNIRLSLHHIKLLLLRGQDMLH